MNEFEFISVKYINKVYNAVLIQVNIWIDYYNEVPNNMVCTNLDIK